MLKNELLSWGITRDDNV